MRENPSIKNVLLLASPLPFWSRARVDVIFTTMVSSYPINFTALTALLCSIHIALLMSMAHPEFSLCHVFTQSVFLISITL